MREDRTWLAMARRFSEADLHQAYIGEDWRRRILYEVSRTPRLIRISGEADPPKSPTDVDRHHLDILRRSLPWASTSIALHFAALRRFLRWAGNPLASDGRAWSLPTGTPSHRRWLTQTDLARLYRSARGLERLVVSLEGFNGLRRIEVLRLRSKDVDLPRRRLRVLGKGKNGGKWRTVPLFSETEKVLRSQTSEDGPDSPVVPLSRSGVDLLLRRAAVRSGLIRRGICVSHHDLRRTFGRLSHQAGMDLVQLKNLYGHASLDQTVHYIGLDEDEMRAGLDSLARALRPLINGRSR